MISRFLLCVVLFSVLSPPLMPCRAETGSLKLTLAQSIRIALRNDPTLRAAEASVRSAEYDLASARLGSGYRTDLSLGLVRRAGDMERVAGIKLNQTLPTGAALSLWSNLDQTRRPKGLFGTSPLTDLDYGISLQQDLFTHNPRKLDVEGYRVALQMQRNSYQEKRRDLILSVTKAFYAVIRQEKNLQVREKAVEYARTLTALLRQQFGRGVSVDVDLLPSQVQLSRSQVYLRLAQLSYEKAKTELLILLGLDPDQPLSLDYNLALDGITLPSPARLREAILDHPRVKAIELQIRDNRLKTIPVEDRFDRKLSITTSYGRYASGGGVRSTVREFQEDWSVGISLEFPLWDQGVTDRNVRSMLLARQALEAVKDAQIRAITREVEKELRNLERLRQAVELLTQAEEYAKENLRLANRKFSMGLNRAEDVIRAQQSLTASSLDVIEQQIAYRLSLANLYALTGLDAFAPEGIREK